MIKSYTELRQKSQKAKQLIESKLKKEIKK